MKNDYFAKFVLTAAHCAHNIGAVKYREKAFVVIGDHGKNGVTKCIEGRPIPHPDYDHDNLDNDVALIR